MKTPIISIVTANYNNSKFLPEFFNSILNQDFNDYELIFIDDQSTDDSIQVAQSFTAYFRENLIISSNRNKGFANALNAGIKKANGKYIARIDSDDRIKNSRLVKQLKFMEEHNLDVVGSNIQYFDSSSGKSLFYSNVPTRVIDIEKSLKNGRLSLIHGSLLLKKEFFTDIQYSQSMVPAEDMEILCKGLKSNFRYGNLKDPLTEVRVHVDSVSNSLRFETILKHFLISKIHFNNRTNIIFIYLYFLHIKFYRGFLFEKSPLKKFFFLLVSSLLNPLKVIRHLKNKYIA